MYSMLDNYPNYDKDILNYDQKEPRKEQNAYYDNKFPMMKISADDATTQNFVRLPSTENFYSSKSFPRSFYADAADKDKEDKEKEEGSNKNWIIWGGILLVIIIIVVLWMMSKKSSSRNGVYY